MLRSNVQGCTVINFFLGVSLCTEHSVDAETFIEQWMAFSLTTLNGAPPTLENLELLAKREFSQRSASRHSANEVALSSTGKSLTVYGISDANQYPFRHFHVFLLLLVFSVVMLFRLHS